VICALAVVEGLGWVTWQALRLETRERQAQAQSDFSELTRLALWRMESEITPILAHESARPYFHYRSFYFADHAYNRMFQQVETGEFQVASPLLESPGQYIRLHYQVEPDGTITSPQAPTGNMRDLAESQYVDGAFIVLAEQLLDELRPLLTEQDRFVRQETRASGGAAVEELALKRDQAQAPVQDQEAYRKLESEPQSAISANEYKAREQAAQIANAPPEQRRKAAAEQPQAAATTPTSPPPPPAAAPEPARYGRARADADDLAKDKKDINAVLDETSRPPRIRKSQGPGETPEQGVEQGPLKPRWCINLRTGAPELLIERTVRAQDGVRTQGFWMDWPALRNRLLAVSSDLLPAADLLPLTGPGAESAPSALRLASIPVLLAPGSPTVLPAAWLTPTHTTLGVTWLAVLAAIVAIALVLRASMELGDRRGRFVSAVTHELRTPLTTFCLYTEMLADGMVPDETTRRDYLSTLKGESRRLAGIVENVLDYARLGGLIRANGHGPTAAPDLLSQTIPALDRRATAAGMTLEVRADRLDGLVLAADHRTVERILLNLVDNACKYAAQSDDRRIHLAVAPADGAVRFTVRDHGPGVPRAEHRRIFQPFHRARRDAAGPQSGLGLGLALARGLARSLGGDLRLTRDRRDGAEFILTIPTVPASTAAPSHAAPAPPGATPAPSGPR
jgi:signal transduction histidine kinase